MNTNKVGLNTSKVRVRFVAVLSFLIGIWLIGVAPRASAQAYPTHPIRFIVPYTPGAGGDIVSRLLAERLTVRWGQSVIVENRGGASGAVGTEAGARAAPDGYVWTLGSDPAITMGPLLRKVPYDPIKDFAPVTLITKAPLVIVVNRDLPVRTLQDFIALAKKSPDRFKYTSQGPGSPAHLAAETLKSSAGIEMLHVPYKGQSEAMIDIIAGRADLTLSSVGAVLGHLQSGRLRALAVTSEERVALLPDVPTLDEVGYKGLNILAWYGLLVPKGTPAAIVDRINTELHQVLDMPDVKDRLTSLGFIPGSGGPAELGSLISSDLARWGKLIKEKGIVAN